MLEFICILCGLGFVAIVVLVFQTGNLYHRLGEQEKSFQRRFRMLEGMISEYKRRIDELENSARSEKSVQPAASEPQPEKQLLRPLEHIPAKLAIDVAAVEPAPTSLEGATQRAKAAAQTKLKTGIHAVKTPPPIIAEQVTFVPSEKEKPVAKTPPPIKPAAFTPPPITPADGSFQAAFQAREEQKPKPASRSEDAVPRIVNPKSDKERMLNFEMLIGTKALGWIAAVMFVVFAVFLIQYAVTKNLIPPFARVIGLAILGGMFLAAGFHYHRVGWKRFSTMLNSCGTMILFLSGYATYAYYGLISGGPAMGLLSFIVLGAFVLAWFYRSVLLGMLAIIGGLVVPPLLSTGGDNHFALFGYLFLLNLGALLLLNLMRRVPLGLLVMFGTQMEFLLWYDEYFTPEKLKVALLFQTLIYGIYLIDTSIGALSRRFHTSWDDTVRGLLTPIIAFGWFHVIVRPETSDYFIGVCAFIACGWYALINTVFIGLTRGTGLMGFLSNRSVDDATPPVGAAVMIPVTMVISLAFLAIGIPLSFGGEWVALGWLAVAAMLWAVGNRIELPTFQWMAGVFFILGIVKVAIFDIPGRNPEYTVPLFNIYAGPTFLCAVAVLASVAITGFALREKFLDKVDKNDRNVSGGRDSGWWKSGEGEPGPLDLRGVFNSVAGIIGLVLLCVILSIECFSGFRLSSLVNALPLGVWSLSVLWVLLGSSAIWLGIVFRNELTRICGFMLLGLAGLKTLGFDLASRYLNIDSVLHLDKTWLVKGALSTPVFNEHALPIFFVAFSMIVLGFVISRMKNSLGPKECELGTPFMVCGFLVFWVICSIENFHGLASSSIRNAVPVGFWTLSLLWVLIGAGVLITGLEIKNEVLRKLGILILSLAALKVFVLDFLSRYFQFSSELDIEWIVPGSLRTPVFNEYAIPLLIVAAGLLVIGFFVRKSDRFEDDERRYGTIFMLSALVQFVLVFSIECFHGFRNGPLANAVPLSVYSLSVLWLVLAISILLFGIRMKSESVRIFAFMLLGLCSLKVIGFDLGSRFFLTGPEEWFAPGSLHTPLLNAHAIPILLVALGIIGLRLSGSLFGDRIFTYEKDALRMFGFLGILQLWAILSVECAMFFMQRETIPSHTFHAHSSLTVLWSVFAVCLVIVGIWRDSKTLCGFGLSIFCAAAIKVLALEMFAGLEHAIPIFNSYALPILALIVPMGLGGIYAWKGGVFPSEETRKAFAWTGFLGLVLLWILISVECFNYFNTSFNPGVELDEAIRTRVSIASLGILWALFAIALNAIGSRAGSVSLRFFSLFVCFVLGVKTVVFDLYPRPDFSELGDVVFIGMPLLNLYFLPLFFVSLTILFFAYGGWRDTDSEDDPENQFFTVLGYFGLFVLWASSSFETYLSMDPAASDPGELKIAHLALSVLWAVFGGVLMFFGFFFRVAPLRWVALLLFAVTIGKVFLIDLASIESIYKIVAILVLAFVLFLAARAYQRFNPENR